VLGGSPLLVLHDVAFGGVSAGLIVLLRVWMRCDISWTMFVFIVYQDRVRIGYGPWDIPS
jgi:hypothetical protein